VLKFNILPVSCGVLLLSACVAYAAGDGGGHEHDWGNLALRVLTAIIFVGIIWKAAGSKLKNFFVGRRTSIIQEMDELDRLKKEAAAHLAEIDRRVANVEAECAALLEEGRVQAESLKTAILADAEKQAVQIVEQARRSAEQEVKAELESLRAALAEEIVTAMEESLRERLDANAHQKLIDNSLTKVVLQ